MVAGSSQPLEIFFSYAHTHIDEALRKELEKHLSFLEHQEQIILWHDQDISAGQERPKEIDQHLRRAQIILLLVSADFIASQRCYSQEMKQAIERHKAEIARVIPIILRPCEWENTPFGHLTALPTNAKAITSWPDRDEALLDVARGIRRVVEELQQQHLRRNSSSLTINNLPYERNILFTGREELLDHLYTSLRAEKTRGIPQALSGLGGIGKTQTAIEYAYRYQNDYETILWIKADSQETFTTDMLTVAQLLNLPIPEDQDRQIIVKLMKQWLQQHDHWLLILDNADDLAIVHDLLSPNTKGHTLITTRTPVTGRMAQRTSVEYMNPQEGALFLLRRTTRLDLTTSLESASSPDQTTAEEIVRLLGGLPLALDQAGAFIEETTCSLENYLKLFHTRQAALLKRRGKWSQDHPDPVATTWSLSFEQVQQANSAAADLLRFCAFLDSEAIPLELITKGASHLSPALQAIGNDPMLLHEAIGTLYNYSLLSRNIDQSLTVHRLVQSVIRQDMDESTQQQWAERAVKAMNAAFPSIAYSNWHLCRQYLPHALRCATFIRQWHLYFHEAADLLNTIGRLLDDQGRYPEAEPHLQYALKIREHVLGPDHPDTATSLNNLAHLYDNQGKYEKIEPYLQRALQIREKVQGLDHPDTASSLNALAYFYNSQGKYEQAEPLYQRALQIREHVLGPDHPDTALSLNNLAALYDNQGKYEQAEPLLQRALQIREHVLGPDHPDTATCLNNLAILYDSQGKYEQAEPLYQRALQIREHMLGPKHPRTQTVRRNLEALQHATKNTQEEKR